MQYAIHTTDMNSFNSSQYDCNTITNTPECDSTNLVIILNLLIPISLTPDIRSI